MIDDEMSPVILTSEYQENLLDPEQPVLLVSAVPVGAETGDTMACYTLGFATAIDFAFRLANQTIAELKKNKRFSAFIQSRPELWQYLGHENIN